MEMRLLGAVRGATSSGGYKIRGLQIQGATSLRSTDFASAARTNQCGGLQDSGGLQVQGGYKAHYGFWVWQGTNQF